MSEYLHRSHNVTVLMYHLVFPAKYRRVDFDGEVETVLKEVCLDIEKRCELKFIEIGADQDHVYFLFQSIPTYSVAKIMGVIKSITAQQATLLPALTQQDFPSNAIKTVVPYGTGTGVDVASRLISVTLGKQLAQPVLIKKQTGSSRCVRHSLCRQLRA